MNSQTEKIVAVIDEIHRKVNTASDRALSEAREIIKNADGQ